MICIVRIQTQEKPEQLWNEVINHKDELQKALGNKGHMLYLSKRKNHKEVSLFVHIADSNILGCFVAEHLAKLQGVDSIWLINLLKPVFHPVSEDTKSWKRFTVTIKVYSPRLSEVYKNLANLKLSEGIQMSYLAYTFHLFGDCLKISLSARAEADLQKYVQEVISKMPGVLRTTVCEIENTLSFVSYEEWQKYITQNAVLVEWDEKHMVAQFNN